MMKLKTTPGPAMLRATIPATRYIPVPQQDPTPREVKSNVVRHFYSHEMKEKQNKNETKAGVLLNEA